MSEFSKGFKSRRPDKSFYDPAFASGWWVYGTLILSWCLDLLPLIAPAVFPELSDFDLGLLDDPSAAARIYYWLAFAFGSLDRRRYGSGVRTARTDLLHGGFLYGIDECAPQLVSGIAQVYLLIPYFLYIPAILLTIEAFCFGNGFGPWSIFAQGLLSVVIWPAWCWLSRADGFLITGLNPHHGTTQPRTGAKI